MSTYLQFLRTAEARRRVWWVCGSERRLVEDVVDRARAAVDAPDQARFSAREVRSSVIWDELDMVGLPRFVLVRDAEDIGDWVGFLDWMDARSTTHVCFVSNEADTDTSVPHLQVIVKRGRYVRCGPIPREADRIAVLQEHGNIGASEARYLLQRVGGDVGKAMDCLAKCSYFGGGQVPRRVVEALSEPAPADDFVGSLMALRYGAASEAARSVAEGEYGSVVGLLDTKVDAAGRLCRALRRWRDMADVMKSTRLDGWLVKDLMPMARRYDREQVRAAVEALAFVDARLAEGEHDLILETLVALWGVRS